MSDSGWQVLDFSDFKGSLTYKRGNVHVNKYEDGSEVDVPLQEAYSGVLNYNPATR